MVGAGVVYLDSSALVKLVAEEEELAALAGFLGVQPRLASSVLARVEVARALLRVDATSTGRLESVLAAVAFIDLSPQIVHRAAAMLPPQLRSLDAMHLASAWELGTDLVSFVTYDRRMAEAARAAGMHVDSPGRGA